MLLVFAIIILYFTLGLLTLAVMYSITTDKSLLDPFEIVVLWWLWWFFALILICVYAYYKVADAIAGHTVY